MQKSIDRCSLFGCALALLVLLQFAPSAWAQDKKEGADVPKGDPSLLTLDRIFSSKDFELEKTPALR